MYLYILAWFKNSDLLHTTYSFRIQIVWLLTIFELIHSVEWTFGGTTFTDENTFKSKILITKEGKYLSVSATGATSGFSCVSERTCRIEGPNVSNRGLFRVRSGLGTYLLRDAPYRKPGASFREVDRTSNQRPGTSFRETNRTRCQQSGNAAAVFLLEISEIRFNLKALTCGTNYGTVGFSFSVWRNVIRVSS